MIGWSSIFYISIVSAALLLSAMGLWFVAVMPGIDRWNKSFFRDYFIAIMACCLTVVLDFVFYFYHFPKAAVYLVLVLECLLLSLPLPMLTVYLLHCCGEEARASGLLRAELGLWAAYAILLVTSPFIGVFTYVAAENQYYRGPLYALLLLPLAAILLINLAATLRRRARLSRKAFLGFLIPLLLTTVALFAQMFVDILPLVDIGYVLSALSMYSFALSDQIEKDLSRQREIARQQQEIANQRASIMVLQMRPHFIYNTMTSIYCLCDQDPKLAQRVVMDFTAYLRKNFTAIASAEPIPFASELEHARAYLAVEQAQYEDSLFVEYDTPHIWFRVPPLTLQPIVENAVKPGRDPYAGPFHISVRTRKTDSGSKIIVANDGRGFHLSTDDDGEPHTALKNIRQRLEIMCGGSLTIAPNEGGGTVVTVSIPFRPAE